MLWYQRKEARKMQEISKEYTLLFNALTETETTLQTLYASLIAVQRRAEDLFISREDAQTRFDETDWKND
jgi:hypothetical protein